MTSSQIKRPLFVLLLLLTGQSENSFLDKSTLQQGDDFTITCDAESVSVPSEFQNISFVEIVRQSSDKLRFIILAQYKRYSEPQYYQHIPPGRNWIIKFSDKDTGPNNRDMRITLHILKSHYLDSGVYLCNVHYIYSMGETIFIAKAEMLTVDDTIYVKEAETFTATCDADNVFVLPVYSNIVSVNILKTAITKVPQNFTNLARYISGNKKEQNIPHSRNWLIHFSGAGAGRKNRAMKINLVVRDSKCTDTGMYYCNVSYIDSKTTASKMLRVLKIIVEAAATNRVFSWKMLSLSEQSGHQELGTYFILKLMCRFDASSKNATLIWKMGTLMDLQSANVEIFNDYFYQGNITAVDLPSQVGSTCQRKHYSSTLDIIINQLEHQKNMFACFLRHHDKDTEIGKMTPVFTDLQSRKDKGKSVSGSQKGQLSRKLFLLCLGFDVMMLLLRTDGELVT